MYYDKYGRVVQTRATNHLGGYDLVYNELKFTGAPIRNLITHSINGTTPSITELYTYDYNKAQQPTTTTYSLNGGSAITLASNSYDELGRLTSKTRHSNTDTETYAYNVRSWTTNITSGSFQENLYYNTNPLSSNLTFNGNISYSNWTYNGAAKGYLYGYDGLNRILSASFKQGSSGLGDNSFNETFTYDKMGNILTLARKKNNTLIDDLAYHYSNNEKSNQLQYVNDGGVTQNQYLIKEYQNKSDTLVEFAYDANGNMIKDLDREIYTIQYNVLNLPDVVQFKNGNQIKNTYNAGGQKLGTEYFTWLPGANAPVVNTGDVLNLSYLQNSVDQNGTVYIDNIEYNTQNGNSALTTLSRIYNTEGYVENPSSPQYYYYRKDHLGNNREVWLANSGETVQRNQYYPSGLPIASVASDSVSKQQRKYNGKEFVEMHGYDTYDYGARGMYPALDILSTVDPHAEKYYSISPYTYCAGNPVKFIDKEGKYIDIWYQGKDGNLSSFRFDGNNGNKAPKNSYVQNVIKAYNCDVRNEGGDNLKEAATNNKLSINIAPSWVGSDQFNYYNYKENIIHWDPNEALRSVGGLLLSPATLLEHEADHAVAANKDLLGYLLRCSQDVLYYGDAEERRVMQGSERKTAFQNKEFNAVQQRIDHGNGDHFRVGNPTSTTPNYVGNDTYSIIQFWISQNPNIILIYK